MSRREKEEFRLWQRRRDGIWCVVTGSGAGTRCISTRTKVLADAEIFRAQFIAGLKNAPPPPGVLVGELLDRYRNGRGPCTRSLKTIDYHLKVLKPFFGLLLPVHISNAALREYMLERRKNNISDGTVLREVGTLKASLRFAAGNRWIAPLPPLQSPAPQPPARDLWLTREEAQRMLDKAKSLHIRLFIMIALGTAARSGAILELRWEQVDFERRLIDFGRGHGNKRRAIVPMNDEVYEALWFAGAVRTTNYVIEYGKEAVKSIKKAFARLADDCGLECSPHVLRHTAATWLVMDGVPLAEVARLLGDSEKTVERVYGKHAPDYLRRAVGALKMAV